MCASCFTQYATQKEDNCVISLHANTTEHQCMLTDSDEGMFTCACTDTQTHTAFIDSIKIQQHSTLWSPHVLYPQQFPQVWNEGFLKEHGLK